jgi:hypothetical protein
VRPETPRLATSSPTFSLVHSLSNDASIAGGEGRDNAPMFFIEPECFAAGTCLRMIDNMRSGLREFVIKHGLRPCLMITPYSERNDFTGFVTAALIDSKLTVTHAMTSADTNAITKIVHSTEM